MKTVAKFESTTDSESLFPTRAMELLPFSEEPLSEWTADSDISHFLFQLYEGTGYGEYAEGQLSEVHERYCRVADSFHASAAYAIPAPGAIPQDPMAPVFLRCPKFGRVAKSMGA